MSPLRLPPSASGSPISHAAVSNLRRPSNLDTSAGVLNHTTFPSYITSADLNRMLLFSTQGHTFAYRPHSGFVVRRSSSETLCDSELPPGKPPASPSSKPAPAQGPDMSLDTPHTPSSSFAAIKLSESSGSAKTIAPS